MAMQATQQTKPQENGQPPPDPVPRGARRNAATGLKNVDWKQTGSVWSARIKYWAFVIIVKFGALGLIYVEVISAGWRALMPDLSKKLYKTAFPGAWLLEEDETGHKLDLATVAAIILFGVVLMLWPLMLKYWLTPDEPPETQWDPGRYRGLIYCLGILVLGGDIAMFLYSVIKTGWAGESISFTSVVATILYVAIVITICLIGMNLKQEVIDLRKQGE